MYLALYYCESWLGNSYVAIASVCGVGAWSRQGRQLRK